MSTRCMINFYEGNKEDVQARVYRHCDGYPEAILLDLEKFFDAIEAANAVSRDYRYYDPCFLSARFVTWQMLDCAERCKDYDWNTDPNKTNPLTITGIGISPAAHGDIAFEYWVNCSTDKRPVVTHT